MKHFMISVALFLAFSSGVQGDPQTTLPTAKVDSAIVAPDEFRDVASDLRCPTCTGLSVLDSDAPFSVQIKNEVKEQLAAGKGKSEILRFFTDRYGPWILREPPKDGINLWAWLIPGGILLIGPILIWYFVWSRQQGADQGSDTFDYEPKPVEEIIASMKQRLDDLRRDDRGAP